MMPEDTEGRGAGLNVRTIEPQELDTVGQASLDVMRATHKGIVPDSFLNSLSLDQTLRRFEGILQKPHAFCGVARQEDKIVGFTMGSFPHHPPEGFDGELNTIYVTSCLSTGVEE